MTRARRAFRPDYKTLYPNTHISDDIMILFKKSDRKMEYQVYQAHTPRGERGK